MGMSAEFGANLRKIAQTVKEIHKAKLIAEGTALPIYSEILNDCQFEASKGNFAIIYDNIEHKEKFDFTDKYKDCFEVVGMKAHNNGHYKMVVVWGYPVKEKQGDI